MSKLMYYNNTAVAHVGAFPMTTSINHKNTTNPSNRRYYHTF